MRSQLSEPARPEAGPAPGSMAHEKPAAYSYARRTLHVSLVRAGLQDCAPVWHLGCWFLKTVPARRRPAPASGLLDEAQVRETRSKATAKAGGEW